MPQRPKTIAAMQPYLFPYLGYFQLAAAVDEFWLLDDVNFIKRGWMNRNQLLVNGKKQLFTIPMTSGPADQVIKTKTFHPEAGHSLAKLVRSLKFSYAKAPYLDTAVSLTEEVAVYLQQGDVALDFTSCTEFALCRVFELIGLQTPIRRASDLGLQDDLRGSARIRAICGQAGADHYVNMIGGRHLYAASDFLRDGLRLSFLEAVLPPYEQGQDSFVPGLSILDVLAHVHPDDIKDMLTVPRLVAADAA